MQKSGRTEQEFGIEMGLVEDFVHVAAGAAHFLGKPCHAASLSTQLVENHIAEMNIAHNVMVFLLQSYIIFGFVCCFEKQLVQLTIINFFA